MRSSRCQAEKCTSKAVGGATYTWSPPWDGGGRLTAWSNMCWDHLRLWNSAGLGNIPEPKANPWEEEATVIPADDTIKRLVAAGATAKMIAAVREAMSLIEEDSSRVFTTEEES